MVTAHSLAKYDPQQMHKFYDQWPLFAKKAYYDTSMTPPKFNRKITHIVFAGMGGSGAIGDLFASILSKTPIHVSVVKGYTLPRTVDKNTLVVTISISGNSRETLSVLKSARKTNCDIIAFCSGGAMKKICVRNNIKCYNTPMTHSPRLSFITYVYTILKILRDIIPIGQNDIKQSIHNLEKIHKKICFDNLSKTNPALTLAANISKTPVVYYPSGFASVAIRFKSSLQENAKTHIIIEDVIEVSHNGIVAWEKKSTMQPILLQGPDDYITTKQRWKVIKKYFTKNKIKFLEVKSAKGDILTKLVGLNYFLDYTTFYHAVLNKIDPSPIKSIDYIKDNL